MFVQPNNTLIAQQYEVIMYITSLFLLSSKLAEVVQEVV